MQQCTDYSDFCSSVVQQTVDVGLPITLIPIVDIGKMKSQCVGEPRVECCKLECGNGGIELRITQTITYKIPIEFTARSNIGEVSLDCKKAKTINNSPCRYI